MAGNAAAAGSGSITELPQGVRRSLRVCKVCEMRVCKVCEMVLL